MVLLLPEYCVRIKILRYFILLDPCVNVVTGAGYKYSHIFIYINRHSQVVFVTTKVFINLYKKLSNSI